MKKNVVLVDYIQNKEWDFVRGLEESTGIKWETECLESSGLHGGIKNVARYFTYFKLALHVFKHREEYGNIVAWQQFFGLIISFYSRLFRADVRKCPKLYVMELIYKPKSGMFGRIYERFIRYCINSSYINRIFVFSKNESDYYQSLFQTRDDLILPIHYGLEDLFSKYKEYITNEQFYLAAGRSNRDYDFLISEWPGNKRLKIICDNKKLKLRGEMQQLENSYGDDYYKELAKCHAVVIPLKNKNISSGQLVMLQAMMFGKPIIITENKTVRDYLKENEDGYIIDSIGIELREAIKRLDDPTIWENISLNGRKHFVKNHSMKAMGIMVGKDIFGDDK